MKHLNIDHYENHHKEHNINSALNVSTGVVDVPIINPHFKRVKRRNISTDEYVKEILESNMTTLSQAITLVESQIGRASCRERV